MTDESVSYRKDKLCASIVLNRPPVNSIDTDAWRQLLEVATIVGDDPGIGYVVLLGHGRCFSAGGDLQEILTIAPDDARGERGALQQRAVTAVSRIPKPVVAAIEGFAMGGGLEIALAADFRVCARNAFLGLPESKLGMLPAAGGTQRLLRLIGVQAARRMLYSGERVTAEDAHRIGLVDEVAEPGTALEQARRLGSSFVSQAAAIGRIKTALLDGAGQSLSDALRMESSLWGDSLADPDAQRLVSEFMNRSK